MFLYIKEAAADGYVTTTIAMVVIAVVIIYLKLSLDEGDLPKLHGRESRNFKSIAAC